MFCPKFLSKFPIKSFTVVLPELPVTAIIFPFVKFLLKWQFLRELKVLETFIILFLEFY